MNIQQLETWMQGYLQAWKSNDPQDIGRLFSEHAHYYTAPFREPWRGRDGIINGWLNRKDTPGTYTFRYQILGATEDMGFVRGWTDYQTPQRSYSNLWMIKLDDQGTCTEFTEWFMLHPVEG